VRSRTPAAAWNEFAQPHARRRSKRLTRGIANAFIPAGPVAPRCGHDGPTLAERTFEQLLEAAPDAVVGVDGDGRITVVNRQVERVFGYDREELLGTAVERLVPARFRGVHAGHRTGYLADPRTRPMGDGLELFGLRSDGSEFPAEISLSGVETETGTIAIAAIRDVTARQSAERRLQQLLDAAPDAIVGIDEGGCILLVNQQVERVFGYTRDELLGECVERLVPERFRAAHTIHRGRFFDAPSTRPMGADLALFGLRRDGSEFPAEISLSSIEAESGLIAIAAIRDVTERLVAQSIANEEVHRREIIAAMLQAEEAERARIATSLHDDTIQVMTASLLAIDRVLKRQGVDDDLGTALRRARGTIEQATERTRRLTFELRPAVLHEQGMAPAISAMVANAAEELGATASVNVPNRRFDWPVEELVYRTVQEAVANVRKHSQAANVLVTVADRRDRLTGVVADDGRGFDLAEVAARQNRLLHIGLETMVERVRMAGGAVDVDSAPGLGTRVSFDVPLARTGSAERS
jgi:PAS domain S-box-containing protein